MVGGRADHDRIFGECGPKGAEGFRLDRTDLSISEALERVYVGIGGVRNVPEDDVITAYVAAGALLRETGPAQNSLNEWWTRAVPFQ